MRRARRSPATRQAQASVAAAAVALRREQQLALQMRAQERGVCPCHRQPEGHYPCSDTRRLEALLNVRGMLRYTETALP